MAKMTLKGFKESNFRVPRFKLPFWRNDYMYPSKPGISHADSIVNRIVKLGKSSK
jgi:hypothetical protein